jgi:hypothetical protein
MKPGLNPGLKVTYLYHDGDIIEVRIVSQNASFRGSADVYVGTDGLLEAAAVLERIPKDRSDTREVAFGAAGPEFAGGSTRLKSPSISAKNAVWPAPSLQ